MEILCVTYNVLAQRFADKNYPEIDPLVLSQPNRNEKIKKKILNADPDIICLQEVELATATDDFTNEFCSRGYSNFSHVISKKRSNPIGNLIFWKRDKFKCKETTENSTTIFVKLNSGDKSFWICNTHLKAGLRSCEQNRFSQLESTIKICNKNTPQISNKKEASDENKTEPESIILYPIIICGDFNDDLKIKPDGLLGNILGKNKFAVHSFDNSCCVYHRENKAHTFYPFDVVAARDCSCEILDKHPQLVIPSREEPSDHYMCRFLVKL